MESMKAMVLHAPHVLEWEERPVPSPGPGEVLVKLSAVGVCGSDVHYYRHGRIGSFVVERPLILGHESSGRVVAVGAGVIDLAPGDRVAMEPGVPCRRCEACKTGKYNLCTDVRFFATPPIDGTFCEYVVHPADFCYRLPDHVSDEEGAMLEPLSVAVHACRKAELRPGDSVLIAGAGPIGLVTLLVAKTAGASRIFVSDVVDHRLQRARELGAHRVIHAGREQVGPVVVEETGGRGVDAVIECAGSEPALADGLRAAKRGGRVVMVGLGADVYRLPMVELAVKELDLRGIFRYMFAYPAALSLIASGLVDVKPLITHRYGFSDAVKAMEVADQGIGNPVKVMVRF